MSLREQDLEWLLDTVMCWVLLLKYPYVEVLTLVPWTMTLFGDMVFTEVITLKGVH